MNFAGHKELRHAPHELERFYSAKPSITPDNEALTAELELTPHTGQHAVPETPPEATTEATPEAAPAAKPDQAGLARETTQMLPGAVSVYSHVLILNARLATSPCLAHAC